ncbi:hypothetical protein AVEN_251706-1 [Araneus ventricosus]|uniref:Helitron helicase-like domain-containing protein n=1 Tax=Araneus ventricosus TaxID=182803 RepID=A0A4Y2N9E2_ARAVE|nr:hypothetical protein AVEN_251706-1 [Araneus ventricosus]
MYAKIESERLLYIKLNQQKLRVNEYIHLRDAVTHHGNVTDIGRMVILPATYIGSVRKMNEYTLYAMTYVRSYGRPDLFITFTTWSEINEELAHGQSPADRHYLIARVFRQKLIKCTDIITEIYIYGELNCWMHSMQWQKRGLPHAYILIWLKEKLRPGHVDSVIMADIPDVQKDSVQLFQNIWFTVIVSP